MIRKENKELNNILIYVHFNKKDELADYVVYQLEKIKPLFEKIIFISNSGVLEQDKKRLHGLCDVILQRENVGFDFAGWRDGLRLVGWEELKKYDSVTLMNDTCFGPLYKMKSIYAEMESRKVDFWGMTRNLAVQHKKLGKDGVVPEHLQSYFMVFNKNVVNSKTFESFWGDVNDGNDVVKVIKNNETQLTDILTEAGFSYSTVFDYKKYGNKKTSFINDVAFRRPKLIIRNQIPLVKVKAFVWNFDSFTPSSLIDYVSKKTNYPVGLIKKHISNTYGRRTILWIRFKMLILKGLVFIKGLLIK